MTGYLHRRAILHRRGDKRQLSRDSVRLPTARIKARGCWPLWWSAMNAAMGAAQRPLRRREAWDSGRGKLGPPQPAEELGPKRCSRQTTRSERITYDESAEPLSQRARGLEE